MVSVLESSGANQGNAYRPLFFSELRVMSWKLPQPVGNTLGLEIDGEIVPSKNRCQASFLIACDKTFFLWMPRMKIRLHAATKCQV